MDFSPTLVCVAILLCGVLTTALLGFFMFRTTKVILDAHQLLVGQVVAMKNPWIADAFQRANPPPPNRAREQDAGAELEEIIG